MAGLLLIDPAFEMLFDSIENHSSSSSSDSQGNAQPLTWYEYWYKRIIPHAQTVWLSAVVGFNRLSLMVGLMSPVEDPVLTKLLSKEVITRKVWFVPGRFFTNYVGRFYRSTWFASPSIYRPFFTNTFT